LTYRVKEPRATGPLQVPVQPLVRDEGVIVKTPACSGRAA